MTKTIAQLWNGSLEPVVHSGKDNQEIKKLENLLSRHLNKLENELDEKSKKLFEKYHDCINEYVILISEQTFCDGFCLGTKITTEALTGAEQIL